MGIYARVCKNCELYGGGYLRDKKPAPIEYNVRKVLEVAEAYLDNQADFWAFRAQFRACTLTAKEDKIFRQLDSDTAIGYWALDTVCDTVGADAAAVINVAKAFRRHDWKANGWAFNASNRRDCDAFRRAVQA